MADDKIRLLLAELEAEVAQEALELYLRTRPAPFDHRFEYRYRAARTVLETLRQGARELGSVPRPDDEVSRAIDDDRSGRRPLRDRVED